MALLHKNEGDYTQYRITVSRKLPETQLFTGGSHLLLFSDLQLIPGICTARLRESAEDNRGQVIGSRGVSW